MRKFVSLPTLFFYGITAAVLFSTSYATTVIMVDLKTLASTSNLIFRGTVVEVETKNLAKSGYPRIVTDVTFRVHRVYKGKTQGQTFKLRLIGGTYGRYTLKIPGQVEFRQNEEVVLFLEWTGKNYTVCGMSQGKFTILRNKDGTELVQRNLAGLGMVVSYPGGHRIVEGKPESPFPLEKLIEIIKSTHQKNSLD